MTIDPWLWYTLVFLAGFAVGQMIWNIRHERQIQMLTGEVRREVRDALEQSRQERSLT